jgi:hypothetical protein
MAKGDSFVWREGRDAASPREVVQGIGGIIRWLHATAAVCLVLLTFCGCGSGPAVPLGFVAGTVTCQGKPLNHGSVTFMPETGGYGLPSTGDIAADGSFEMRTGVHKGVPLGKYVVTVLCHEKSSDKQSRDIYAKPKSLIPEKYSAAARSGLRFEVKAGNNRYNISLELR